MKLSNRLILLLIIIVATILRFYNYFEIPFTHDEFSALFRTEFGNFSELIEKGVKIDGHPAGIQVFLFYWTRLFGYSEWVVKLPFTIFGLLSVLLIYIIGKKWFNETVGLITASFIATLQFPVIYSQIARPYISGLFFTLLMVYYWTNLIKLPGKGFFRNSVLFIISASLCSYNHHFSLLFAAIVGISGLFLIERKYLTRYIISGVVIFLLYIPHINIFLYQLKVGGVEGWLGKPHNDFIIEYISYIFNFSYLVFIPSICLSIYGIIQGRKENFDHGKLILFALWFFIPFLTGFFYSKYFTAVLQFSVLIFSFPYLFFILFGHLKQQKELFNLIAVAIIIILNTYSLVFEREHYSLFYKSPFKEILTDHENAVKNYKGVVSLIDSHDKISEYYINELNIDTTFVKFDSFSNENDLIEFLKEKRGNSDYLYFGCLSGNNPLTVPIILDYFPKIEWQKNYVGGTSYFFSKEQSDETVLVEKLDFSVNEKKNWTSINKDNIIDTIGYSGNSSYLIDKKTEWSPTYTNSLSEIILNENNFIDITVKALLPERLNDIFLTASLEAGNKNIYWNGTPFEKFIPDEDINKWSTIHCSIKLSDIYLNYRDVKLKVYIWNNGKHDFLIDDIEIRIRDGNSKIYGLTEKIK